MSTPATGAGDPARTLALLWRDPAALPRRGPRRSLSLDEVISAATTLARQRGLAAVTMREVARSLGVVPMTLYTYVPGKAELLDLMLDAAYGQMTLADLTGRPWQERLTMVADENRALFGTHPWAAAVSTRRPPLGPGAIAKYEHELSALTGLGLTDPEIDDCLNLLLEFVRANAAARWTDEITDRQWWEQAGPALARYLDPERYPLATRIGTAAGEAHGSAYDPDHGYRFGLERILDGVAALIAARGGPAHAADPPSPR